MPDNLPRGYFAVAMIDYDSYSTYGEYYDRKEAIKCLHEVIEGETEPGYSEYRLNVVECTHKLVTYECWHNRNVEFLFHPTEEDFKKPPKWERYGSQIFMKYHEFDDKWFHPEGRRNRQMEHIHWRIEERKNPKQEDVEDDPESV